MYGKDLGMSTLLGPRVGRTRNTNTAEMANRVFTSGHSVFAPSREGEGTKLAMKDYIPIG